MKTDIALLLVEDDEAHAELIAAAFEDSALSVTVRHVPTVDAARRALADQAPDVVIADWRLPDGFGTDLLTADQQTAGPPIILMTGFGDEQVAVQAIKAGAMDYIVKSDKAFVRMPQVVQRVLTEWGNIVARRKAESELRRSEENLRRKQVMLARTERIANVGSWEWDVARGTVIWSEELFRIFRRDPSDGPPAFSNQHALYPPEDLERLGKAVDGAIQHGTPYELELQIIRTDGVMRTCLARGYAEMGPDNTAARLFGTLQDISDRKLSETALREALKRREDIERIINLSPATAWQWRSADGWPVDFAPDNVRGLGYAPEDFITGRIPFFSIVHPEDLLRVVQEIDAHAHANGMQSFAQEYRILTADGQVRHMDARTWIQWDDRGKIVRYHGILLDVTERKKAQEERAALANKLQQAQKMESIGNLAGGIAHDFNNILSCIIGYTEIVLDEIQKGSTHEEHLREVLTAGKRAKDLVTQILAFARRSDEQMQPIRIDIVIKEVLKFLRSTIPASIEIRQNISSNCLVMANLTQVHQILMNLCANAAYSMEETGGVLEVVLNDVLQEQTAELAGSGLSPGRYIELKVSDTGSGIPPEVMEHIFEPYFTTKPQGEGTGLGLSVVYGIVESYGGRIFVESAVGQGTIFSVYLPVTQKSETPAFDELDIMPIGTERILFVDDEPQITAIAAQILGRLGYVVTTRTSSLDALSLFKSRPDAFDLVVTDMAMPGMTGDILSLELMGIRPDIPVILCTGYSKKISDQTAAKIGIKALASKPIVKADLAKTIRTVLDEAKSAGCRSADLAPCRLRGGSSGEKETIP